MGGREALAAWPRSPGARTALRAGLVAAITLGCGPGDGAGEGSAAEPAAPSSAPADLPPSNLPPHVERHFRFAQAERAPAAPPSRFAAELPAGLDGAYPEDPAAPPRAYVEALLCARDPDMTTRLVDAVRRARASGVPAVRVTQAVARLGGECVTDARYCGAAEKLAVSGDDASRLAGASLLAECGRPEDAELFDRRDVSALAVFHYLAARRRGPTKPLFTERAGRAALDLAANLDDPRELRLAAATLASFADRNAARALLAMHAVAPRHRHQIAIAAMESRDPELRALAREACERHRSDPLCARPGGARLSLPSPEREALKHPERLPLARVARLAKDPNLRRTLRPKLAACARQRVTAYACTLRLQFFDREAASELAKKLARRDAFGEREELAALAKFPRDGALRAHVERLGFRTSSAASAATTARELLAGGGHVVTFDVETDRSPNQHDVVLHRLARAGGPELAAALFEERPPRGGGPAEYELCGYARGERWCARGRDLGDFYDVDAVVGLLNAMSRDAGAIARFVALATADEAVSVVTGPAAGIAALVDEGLLELGSSDDVVARARRADRRPFEADPAADKKEKARGVCLEPSK